MQRRLSFLLALALAGLPGVAGERADWSHARQSGEFDVLRAFRAKYPKSRHDAEAARMMGRIEWSRIDKTDNDAVRQFLLNHLDDPYFADELKKDIAKSGLVPAASDRYRGHLVELAVRETRRADVPAGIRAALDRLVAAYETKSLPGIADAWPSLPPAIAAAFAREFEHAHGVRMEISVLDEGLRILEDAAVVTAEESRFGEAEAVRRVVSISLTRAGADWIIEDISSATRAGRN